MSNGSDRQQKHEVHYQPSLYWKERFAMEDRQGFVELRDTSSSAGTAISCQGLSIPLERGFDGAALQRLLLLMRS